MRGMITGVSGSGNCNGHFAMEDEISHVKRLGGMTNHTYAVEVKGKKLLVRLPGEGTEQLLNRNDERISAPI